MSASEALLPVRPTISAEEVDELRALAVRVAREAGVMVARMRSEAVSIATTKSSATDVVTRADIASEALIRELLSAARPADGFLGEEGTSEPGTSGLTWVIDPIDGTVNYLYGRADYAVSVAVVLGDPTDVVSWQPVAGCVHQPATGRTYSAGLGRGSDLDGVELRIPVGPDLGAALVGTGFSYQASERAEQGIALAALIPRIRDIRRAGAGALDVCDVASGLLDAHVELGLNPWDVAAAALVASEAGAFVSHTPPNAAGKRVSLVTSRELAPELVRELALDLAGPATL